MKKITAVFLLLITTYGYSEPYTKETTIVCSDPKQAFETLTKEYQEKPIWVGVDHDKNKFVLITNKDTGTWTFLRFSAEYACAIGIGIKYELVYTGPTI